MVLAIGWVALTACTVSPGEPALTLEGSHEVRTDHLGPVSSPRVLLADGTEPPQIVWTVGDAAVAGVAGGTVVAIGAGTTSVTGTAGGDSVVYTLTVVPAVVLRFADPPGTMRVGETLEVSLEDPVAGVDWVSSNPSIATVANGRITSLAPGLVYVTAKKGASEAMLQLEVLPAAPTP